MKVIGLLGGMSWKSTIEYYRLINEISNQMQGGNTTLECVVYSFNFQRIEELQEKSCWSELTDLMTAAANKLVLSGVQILLICANTMHKTAEDLEKNLSIPILHIADAAGIKIQERNLRTVGIIGTKYVMEESFYRDYLTR